MTPEDLQRMVDEIRRMALESEHGKIVGQCSACRGHVVCSETQEFDAQQGPPIIGPGGAAQWRTVKSYHCADCGILYLFPPKKKKDDIGPVEPLPENITWGHE